MFFQNDEDFYLKKELLASGISKVSADFFIDLRKFFDATDEIKTTTEKLAKQRMVNVRTIQRYLKELRDNNILRDRPVYNNDNPDKSYIEYHIITLTSRSDYLMKRVKDKIKREKQKKNIKKNVFFEDVA